MVVDWPTDWIAAKLWLADLTSLDKDALHIYLGVALQLLASRLFAHGLASPWPWMVVFAAALGNEAYDLLFEVWPDRDRGLQWRLSAHDLLNTVAIPTLLLWLARRASPPVLPTQEG